MGVDLDTVLRIIGVLYVACMLTVGVMAYRELRNKVRTHRKFDEIMSRESWDYLE